MAVFYDLTTRWPTRTPYTTSVDSTAPTVPRRPGRTSPTSQRRSPPRSRGRHCMGVQDARARRLAAGAADGGWHRGRRGAPVRPAWAPSTVALGRLNSGSESLRRWGRGRGRSVLRMAARPPVIRAQAWVGLVAVVVLAACSGESPRGSMTRTPPLIARTGSDSEPSRTRWPNLAAADLVVLVGAAPAPEVERAGSPLTTGIRDPRPLMPSKHARNSLRHGHAGPPSARRPSSPVPTPASSPRTPSAATSPGPARANVQKAWNRLPLSARAEAVACMGVRHGHIRCYQSW